MPFVHFSLVSCKKSHLACSRACVFFREISGLVALLRICDMLRWRCCGVNTSGMSYASFEKSVDLSQIALAISIFNSSS